MDRHRRKAARESTREPLTFLCTARIFQIVLNIPALG